MTQPSFEEQRIAQFTAFMNGETDQFDLWAVDPAKFAWAGNIAEGFTITSAGGACPFQAEGMINALAIDGTEVPMHWYYRSRGGWARFDVALSSADIPGQPLYSKGMEEIEEFDYSHWLDNIVSMIPQLEEVGYCYHFPTFAVGPNGWINALAAAPGLGVRELIAAHYAGDPRVAGINLHKLVTSKIGRGRTVAEALEQAKTFRLSEYLLEHDFSEARQRTLHDLEVEHLDPRPFNPWWNAEDVDDRTRPAVALIERPFRSKIPA